MKYYLFEGQISADGENIRDLLSMISSDEENITLGINSNGGEVIVALFLLDVLNSNKHRIQLNIINWAQSSAYLIWAGFEGYKTCYPGSFGVAHMSQKTVYVNDHGKLSGDGEIHRKTSTDFKKMNEKYVVPTLTKKQAEDFWDECDITITYSQLKRIADKHNKINNAIPLADLV